MYIRNYETRQITKFNSNKNVNYEFKNLKNLYINKIWTLKLNFEEKHNHKVLPDACFDLIMDLNNYEIFLCSPKSSILEFDLNGPFLYFGISFNPGIIELFLDNSIDIDNDFLKIENNSRLGKIINNIYKNYKNLDEIKVLKILEYFKKSNIFYSVYSERHNRRVIKKKFTLTPNILKRVIRFQESFGKGYYSKYYDQSHYVKEFKKLTGYTPSKFYKKFEL